MRCKYCNKRLQPEDSEFNWVHHKDDGLPLYGCYNGTGKYATPLLFEDYAQSLLRYHDNNSIIMKKANTKSRDSISGIL